MRHFRYLILLLTGFALSSGAFAQQKRADRKYDHLAYSRAIKLYHKALKKDPGNWEMITKLADSYRRINDSKNAEYWYVILLTK